MAKLYFRYGAMNCGKSSALIQVAYNYKEQGMNVIVIKPQIDTKAEDYVSSRTGSKRKVDYLIDDKSIYDIVDLDNLDAIVVDEAQFLKASQIDELYEISKEKNIPVICYGLRCDYKMEAFSGSRRLLEIADSIEEMKTICKCGSKATQNLRKVNGIPTFIGNQVEIDNQKDITYESVCGKCYLKIRKLEKK